MRMSMGSLGQIQQQSLKQTLSTQQIQYVKLLQMNTMEFNRYLTELHLENPVVELEPPVFQPKEGGEAGAIDLAKWIARRPVERSPEDPNERGENAMEYGRSTDDDRYNLQAYLRSQFDLSLTDLDLSLLERLICSLDENGYLTPGGEQLALRDYDRALVDEAVSYLQTLDPPGVGARDLAECLCVQLRRKGLDDPVVRELVRGHLEELALGRFQKIAKTLGCAPQQIKEHYKLIRTLSPRPASAFGGETPLYILPDVTVEEKDGRLFCTYNKQYNAGLTVNESYLKLAQADASAKEYINRKLSQALWVIKAIQSRQSTIERIVRIILERQRPFFLGSGCTLAPMRLRDVAEQMQVHESTVSRAINEKYLQCKRGIYPLKYFFSGALGVPADDDRAVGSRSIKERIRELIAAEDPQKPLSDSELTGLLAADGMSLARRTVAKYREELGLLSSALRRQ